MTYLFVGKARDPAAREPAVLQEEGLPRRVALEHREVAGEEVRGEGHRDLRRLRGRPAALRRAEGGRRAARRHGHRQARQAQGELPARHGHPREGDRARRGRARQPHQAARRALRARRREPAGLRDRHQGDLAHQAREARSGPRDPRHDPGESAEVLRRHVALRHEGQPGVVRDGVRARRHEPLPRPAPRGAEVQDASRGCATCSTARSSCGTARRRSRSAACPRCRSSTPMGRCSSATPPASATRRSSPASTWR